MGDEDGTAAGERDAGLGVKVYVSPKAGPTNDRFAPADFTSTEDGTAVTCPAGKTSQYRQRDIGRHAMIFRFTRQTCDACSRQQECVDKPGRGAFGRSVTKNDYEAEYQRARERATTDEYAEVRREHSTFRCVRYCRNSPPSGVRISPTFVPAAHILEIFGLRRT